MITAFPWKWAVRTKSFWFSLTVILIFGLIAALAPWIAPHDPYNWEPSITSLPPAWVKNSPNPGQAEYLLGTDRFGVDILSRLIYGTRTAVLLAAIAVPLAALIGTLIGLIAGDAGGRIDAGITFFLDVVQSLPGIMFMVITILILRNTLAASWFHGMITLIVGFAAVAWVNLARLIRINVMMVKSQLFIEAAVSLGATHRRIIFRHLLPNVAHVIIVWIITTIPAVILLEAVLGYIGVAVTSPNSENNFTAVSWGGMFFSGRSRLSSNPLMLIIPSLCILLISMSFILLADLLKRANRGE